MDKNLSQFFQNLTQLAAQVISEFRKDKKDILNKSDTLKNAIDINTDLSVEETAKVTSAINELHKSIKKLIDATNASKTETVSVANLGDAKTDLTPLERNFEALRASVETVRDAINSIEPAKSVSMAGVEKLLSKIADKKEKEVDVSELEVISDILNDVLLAVQTTSSFASQNPADKIVPELKSVQDILAAINKSIEAIDVPEFDYKKLAKIIKDNLNIQVATSGGSSEYVKNTKGEQINPATSQKQNQYQKTGTTTDEPNQGYAGHQFTIGYIEDASRGFISGASIFSSYGLKTNAGATTRQPVHPTGVLNLPGAAGVQMAFVSTSANDTEAGSGIQQIRMSYVEAVTLTAKTETITLNGTTPVNSVATNILFVNDLRMTRGGSGAFSVAAGDISMTGVGTGTFYGRIFAGATLQKSAFRMIPAGKRFVVKQIFIGSVSTTADTYSIFELVLKIGDYFIATNGLPVQNGSQNIDLWAGTALPAGVIFGGVETTSKASVVSCSFIGILENA